MAFRPGQEIECISDDWWGYPGTEHAPIPVLGAIYHFVMYHPVDSNYLVLQELDYVVDGIHGGYMATNFRAIVKTKTDISIFTAMLGPRVKETLDA